ncbi:UNKNOWN [Stylonychia lemnae]|uniref:Transmembrane protein n=1 Tax=Stylonychia lemnae TaxID=5949 RepID=A0A078A892_STYLE|nr:UNKNOWN [Stylonychia lemnae]|eukprot:CDW78086.1 UNKNOWN [Stylonychia lemnae]
MDGQCFNCSFIQATNGGSIYMLGDANLYIEGSKFKQNLALSGGAIYASRIKGLTIINSEFLSNRCTQNLGCNVYVSYTDNGILIDNTQFESLQSNSFYCKETILRITSSRFYDESVVLKENQMILQDFSGGLYLEEMYDISMLDLVFKNLRGKDGGAIFIQVSDTFKKTNLLDKPYSLTRIQIQNCLAMQGGAIYIHNVKKLNLIDSQVKNNHALQKGGGIYYYCQQDKLIECSLDLGVSTQITENIAEIQGGGIFWNFQEPIGGMVYKNKAYLYGNNYSGVGFQIKQYNSKSNTTLEQTQIIAPQSRSGGEVEAFYVVLVDKYGEVMRLDSTSKISLNVISKKRNLRQTNFTTSISGITTFYAQNGTFNISGLIILGGPNQTSEFTLTSNGIDMNIPDNFNTYKTLKEYQIQVVIKLRSCKSGEGLSDSGECFDCPVGFYLIEPPFFPTDCLECNSVKAICLGGDRIGPKPGFWRKSNLTNNFQNCPKTEACLGMLAPDYNPRGECLSQYLGPLCSVCMPGYQKNGEIECSRCPELYLNIMRIIAIVTFLVFMITMMVRSNYNSANTKKIHSVYFKIFMNHLQLLVLCSQFDFQWPSYVKAFFDSPSPIASSSEQIVSIDCFIDRRESNTVDRNQINADLQEWRIIYSKITFLSLLPIYCAINIAAVLYVYLKYKNLYGEFESFFMSTNVVIFFLFHPTITQYMINMFKQEKIFHNQIQLSKL